MLLLLFLKLLVNSGGVFDVDECVVVLVDGVEVWVGRVR